MEDAKKWYLEGNSIRKTVVLIFRKYKVKIDKETLRKVLKNVIKLRDRENSATIPLLSSF